MMQAIAVDDEPMALGVIRKFALRVPFMELPGSFTNAFDALIYLKHRKTDLIFLDIKMPDISGIDLLKGLADPPLVIFTTAHSEYAVQSFELNAVDYLLKPFSQERFEQACTKALDMYQWRQQERASKPISFFVKSGYESIQIFFDQILFAESVGNYVQFFLKGRRITSRLTMTETEKLLMRPDFIRVHRRFIVAKREIARIDKKALFIGNIELPVGETYWKEVKKLLPNA
jgi:two-component system LytT family response regulator